MTLNQEKMLNILTGTVYFYSQDTNRRSIYDLCGELLSPNGNKCSIGRFLTDEELNEFVGDSTIINFWDRLKNPIIKALPLDFWLDIQRLHDDNMFWDVNNLSQDGIQWVIQMRDNIKNNKYLT